MTQLGTIDDRRECSCETRTAHRLHRFGNADRATGFVFTSAGAENLNLSHDYSVRFDYQSMSSMAHCALDEMIGKWVTTANLPWAFNFVTR